MSEGYILIADDKEENLLYLSALLRSSGFTVKSTLNGVEALATARMDPPLLIISDLLMPVMDGYTLLRHWKSEKTLMGVPFIVYTSTYTEPDDEQLALNMGADAFVMKPAEPAQLLAYVRSALSRPAVVAHFSPSVASTEDSIHLQQYSETLIRKLEEKTRQLVDLNRELQDSREKYLLLLNSTAEGIYGLDIDGICTFCNSSAARMLGYENPFQVVGRTAHDQHHHSHADGSRYWLKDCRVHGVHRDGEGAHGDDEMFFRKDGSPFPVEYWSYPIKRGKEVVGSVVTFLDISERRNLEAQFLQSQKMEAIGRLAGGVAHDFNNALQVVLICSELLAERVEDTEQRGFIEEIRSAGQRAATLTRRLLAFSRRSLQHPVVLNLNSVVLDMKDMLRRMIGEDVSLALFFDPDIWSIRCDVGQIEQVLMNLAVNARDAMPGGGELIVSTANVGVGAGSKMRLGAPREGRYALLRVRDTGTGMDERTRKRIFEPFFTTKEAGRGTGLGLSTVYSIVQQSDGFIHVDSEPGKGTSMDVYFPQASGPLEHSFAHDEEELPPRGSETVLVVEDEESLRTLVANALREHGYHVLEAKDGRSGLDVGKRSRQVDLLLTDVILPDISGPQVVAGVLAAHSGSKALYMSGYSDEHISSSGLAEQRVLLLEKPFSIAALLSKVREALDAPP